MIDQLFCAHVERVRGTTALSLRIDLGFGVNVLKRVSIRRSPIVSTADDAQRANHCLIILVGGKRVVIGNVDHDLSETGIPTADVYVDAPGATSDDFVTVDNIRMFSVATVLHDMSALRFSVEHARHLAGKKVTT